MKKKFSRHAAIDLFGSVPLTAKALRISRQAVYKWPAVLGQTTRDRIIAALTRSRRPVPRALRA